MGRLFALADLHLSLSGAKPMDMFGEIWAGHDRRMARAWDATVAAEDTVLLAGDLTWARTLADAAPDLEWIGCRPGRKLLLRGNHDSWWASPAKVRRALPPNCDLLQNCAFQIEQRVIVGARGWLAPDDPIAEPGDEKIFHRELERLRLSVAHADREFDPGLPRIAMLHYPPWIEGREPTELVRVIQDAGVRSCVFGHLHGKDHRLAITGRRAGIDYLLVAADAVAFRPVEILLAEVE